tara:strand:- start:2879 stop:3646 length:768 start_codon:yes stop_codon:yes gene_type:complete
MAENKKYDFPTEVITLPSQGKCYPEGHPLASGEVEIKYMTAKEEEILSSQNLIKKGVVLDMLFESIIADKTLKIDDIVIGDKNAIVLATRILGYGPEYKIQMPNEFGENEDIIIDLSKVQTKDIDYKQLKRDNLYEFVTPTGKNVLKFKLLTHGDEKKVDTDVRALDRLNKGGVSQELTTRYRYMIKSVDGKEDTKSIVNFINNKFLSRDTRAFRNHLSDLQPDMDMSFEYDNPESGEKERMTIPMGVGFFYPSE